MCAIIGPRWLGLSQRLPQETAKKLSPPIGLQVGLTKLPQVSGPEVGQLGALPVPPPSLLTLSRAKSPPSLSAAALTQT